MGYWSEKALNHINVRGESRKAADITPTTAEARREPEVEQRKARDNPKAD